MKFTIGSDPEIFVKDKQSQKIETISGILGGNKENPLDIGMGCAVQEDNILAEFNIPPVRDKESFIKYIEFCKDYISTMAAANGLELHYSSSEIVEDNILDENSKEFGCSPSINVITQTINAIKIEDVPEELKLLRTSGFHIHFGNENLTEEQAIRLVMCFELMCSIPLNKYDNDKFHRRQFYGMFGDCRIKDYGVECRSLGGYFLKDEETLSMVWECIENTIELFNNAKFSDDEIQQMLEYCIGENDTVIEKNIDEILNTRVKQ